MTAQEKIEKTLRELVKNNGGIHPEPVGIDYALVKIINVVEECLPEKKLRALEYNQAIADFRQKWGEK